MNYSDNYYVRTSAYSFDFNKLNESIQCDVCIIGAGLSGISTAYYLNKANPELNIVILEKNKVGWGCFWKKWWTIIAWLFIRELFTAKT